MQEVDLVSKKIRLRQIRCFVTVARRRSFVLAAESLGLTQPAVSRSVRELEQILGQELIDRSTRGADVTPRGRAFLEAVEAALLQIWRGTQAVVGEVAAEESVRIGALPNVCSQFLPAIIRDFKQEFPSATVRVIPGTNADLLGSLRRGETDFVIGRLSTSQDMKGLMFEALFDEPLIFAARQDHPLAGVRPALQEVVRYPMVLPPEGTIIRQEASRFLASHGVMQLSDVVETTSSEFQRAYLAMTDAVAVVPRGVLQSELEQGVFVQLEIGGDEMRGPVGLTLNPTLTQSDAMRQLLQMVRRAA